ncbi:hypothetical protein GNE08_09955 [Trichormus variabilis ARAD]|uniref:Uncharacterized protein n=1 Tax=Trichormus variabilis N2B TaxID=2681315 RepID=A0ABR6S5G2_ANAVA|nr:MULTISPECIES: hypothetical protein [Nostocaceae]MBC1214546.1 hypothetical protein [Trichormus variabilis ARAD]MBC1266219.1 hypothetical protein [Trichormus variabilis FSR]MBC1301636.1 hypothetical protein [Trichormus variabilis N2B]MBC1311322.1 hypothetical protein [Trichormus variabilis PNB]MBC1327636.1 hypothetical protein [Trichormus variabilis 9RC]
MANIAIDTLHLTGYDLLSDADSFLDELFHQETSSVGGGWGKSYGYNSLFGGGYSGSSGSYNSFSGGFSGHGGYYNRSWC